MTAVATLPKFEDIVKSDSYEHNAFMVLLNQNPPAAWIKTLIINGNPVLVNGNPLRYIPRERLEYLLCRIFTEWSLEIKTVQLIANSVCVTVKLHVVHPVSGKPMWHDGVGAAPLQTDKGAGATDFNKIKSNAVQIGAPAAETFAFKDACEKFGKLFGKDLNLSNDIDFNHLYKSNDVFTKEDLRELFELKKDACSAQEQKDAERIITKEETQSYSKLKKLLQSK